MIIVSVILLLILSAIFSGLTLGYMSLDPHELKRKANLGNVEARIIYPLRRNGNQLLVTLILGNILVNAILTVVLDSVTNGVLAVLIATGLIVVFGEIIPQAAFGRYAIRVGALAAPAMNYLMKGFHPVAKPLSMILDRMLGEELPTFMSKDELVKVIEEHSLSDESNVAQDELTIVEHALTFADKRISDYMTPRSVVVAVKENDKLTLKLMNELHESGHSRFPVVVGDLDHVSGTLYLRDLVIKKEQQETVADLMEQDVHYVNADESLDHALNAFLKTKRHLFIVVNEFAETVGVITIEDIIEQIMGRKIIDEFDRYDDLRHVAHKRAHKKLKNKKL